MLSDVLVRKLNIRCCKCQDIFHTFAKMSIQISCSKVSKQNWQIQFEHGELGNRICIVLFYVYLNRFFHFSQIIWALVIVKLSEGPKILDTRSKKYDSPQCRNLICNPVCKRKLNQKELALCLRLSAYQSVCLSVVNYELRIFHIKYWRVFYLLTYFKID